MNISHRFLFAIILLFLYQPVFNQDFETYTYYVTDSLKLEMDILLPSIQPNETVPLLIYVHGGGFSKGDRTGGHKLGRYLAGKGFAAASISYTLYMKDKSFGCDGITSEKIKAIQIAANQLWLATNFMLKNAEKFSIDTNKIFIAGSSAGAETVLHAAFWDRAVMGMYADSLSKNFRYAGVVSGAGAIMDLNLITQQNAIPAMLFHGSDDPVVPYRTAAHHFCKPNASGWLMLFGSRSIYYHLVELGTSVSLTSFLGGNHSYHGAFYYQNQAPVAIFMEKVLAGQAFQEHVRVQVDDGDGE